MKRVRFSRTAFIVAGTVLAGAVSTAARAEPLRVCATIPDLASLTEEIGGGLPSIIRILCKASLDELFEAVRQRRDQRAKRCRFLRHDRGRQPRGRLHGP